jgi:signal transduction histidine kinase/CheY-like chemotaxis protein
MTAVLRVRDALVPAVQHAKLEQHPSDVTTEAGLFAVFGGDDAAPELVGLVSIRQIARFPNRIFADLVPKRKRAVIRPDESVEAAIRQMETEQLDALAVVEDYAFVGAVTRESIFFALHSKERALREALRRSEEQLRAILGAIPDNVICFNEEGTILAMFTRSPAPIAASIGDSLEDVLPPDVAASMRGAIGRCLSKRSLEMLPVQIEADGRASEYEARFAPSGPSEVVCILRDATEMQKLRAQLVFADRKVAMGTLAAGVAHEINNPLTYMMANVALLRRTLKKLPGQDGASEQANALLDIIDEGASRIGTIVRDLRAFVRPDEPARTPVDVRRSLDLALNIARPYMHSKAGFSMEIEPVPLVLAGEARLGQVFLNLLVNAAQAIPAGASEAHKIHVSVRRDPEGVRVVVRDTGVGLTKEIRARLFEPFFTTKQPDHGTGLGLFITNNIVTSLGGRIEVEDVPGGGTAFHVILPAADEDAEEPGIAVISGSLQTARVLLVDDEVRILEALAPILDPHVVVTARNGREALELLPGGFDVILCDLIMPVMDGMELFAEASARFPGLGPRFLFLTAGATTDAARAFLSSVPNTVLSKPVAREVLLVNIEQVLSRVGRAAPRSAP